MWGIKRVVIPVVLVPDLMSNSLFCHQDIKNFAGIICHTIIFCIFVVKEHVAFLSSLTIKI